MSRNGSGTFSLLTNSWQPAVNGVPATAADWQALITDVASALTQSVSRDGQTAITGNLQMGGNKLTGLGLGSASGDSLPWQQLFSQGLQQDLASASVTDIGAVNSTLVNVTGTTTITSFGTTYNGPRFLRFAGALTLTNSATLVLPGGANITTAAGDSATVVPLGNPATGWRVVDFVPLAALPARAGPLASSGITGAAASGANSDITGLTGLTSVTLQNPGEVCFFARNTTPSGFMKANGALVSRTTYAALFAVIGTTFGVGDGSTTFALPDLRGEFIRGWDDGRGVDSGRANGSAQSQDLQPHTHTYTPVTMAASQTAGGIYPSGVTGSSTNTGSAGTTETRPRNIALLACIKF